MQWIINLELNAASEQRPKLISSLHDLHVKPQSTPCLLQWHGYVLYYLSRFSILSRAPLGSLSNNSCNFLGLEIRSSIIALINPNVDPRKKGNGRPENFQNS
jgi:hypothetical protein